MKTATCYRCHRTLPESSFYHRADGSLISGCRECHKELSAQRRTVSHARRQLPALAAARVVAAPATPPLAVWTCECCRLRHTTALNSFPASWRKLADLIPGEPVVLCGPCGTKAVRGARVLRAVLASRASS